MRQLITDAQVLDSEGNIAAKPCLLYGDNIVDETFIAVEEECRWLREVEGHRMFLPPMARCYSISDFQHESIIRTMNERLSGHQDGVTFRRIDCQGGCSTEIGAQAVGLLPGNYGIDMPADEVPVEASVFTNSFSRINGHFPGKEFRAEGWVYGPLLHWWHILVNFVLKECDQLLHRAGLYEAVLATRVGFLQSHQNFYGILESFNPDIEIFFTHAGKLGVMYHDMHHVSGLSYGEYPYEECFYSSSEIEGRSKTKAISTYWEVLCHFHICMDKQK